MKIAIIGAGASGLFLAMLLSKTNCDISVFYKGKIGRKLLASGNGKCNISNMNVSLESYNNNKFAYETVTNYQTMLFDIFREIKIYTKQDNEGRLYPYSESSQSVLNIITSNIKAKFIEQSIFKIAKINNKYYLNNDFGPFDKVIVATGSNANFIDYSNYVLPLDTKAIKFKQFTPSLVGFKVKENIKKISGTRAKARVTLYCKDKLIHFEDGEIIFKDDGISGICIMNLSSYYAHENIKNENYINIDLLPDLDFDDYRSVLTPKLYEFITTNKINVHQLKLNILNTYSLEFAQVACGGIDLNEINDNFELNKMRNVYAIGEVLDVDGICGGYNLMFAFTSALKVFEVINNEISNK